MLANWMQEREVDRVVPSLYHSLSFFGWNELEPKRGAKFLLCFPALTGVGLDRIVTYSLDRVAGIRIG